MTNDARDTYKAYAKDVYTEPDSDPDTLANLGPLTRMAGIWQGTHGMDINPKADGPETQSYLERMELHPIDPQPNGPQLFYGLRYHTHIIKPDDVETYHDQVGYWLWEPATETVIHTLAIPRAQVAMAGGNVRPDADAFTVAAKRGSMDYGICSNPFLEQEFKTESFEITVTFYDDGTWGYSEDTVMILKDRTEPFHHVDSARLKKIGEPKQNPLMAKDAWV